MTTAIITRVGEDHPDAILSTTVTAYAMSSILTGVVFLFMGVFRMGYIVGFIPRHILTGCIGGVGFFLIATGFEITARLDGNLEYNLDTLKQMFSSDRIALWLIPLVLGIILYYTEKRITSKLYFSGFIMTIMAVFYFFVYSLDQLDPVALRKSGWIFDSSPADEPWWFFYTLYGRFL